MTATSILTHPAKKKINRIFFFLLIFELMFEVCTIERERYVVILNFQTTPNRHICIYEKKWYIREGCFCAKHTFPFMVYMVMYVLRHIRWNPLSHFASSMRLKFPQPKCNTLSDNLHTRLGIYIYFSEGAILGC